MNEFLTEYSKRFLSYLANRAPRLKGIMRPAMGNDGRLTGFLFGEIQSPSTNTSLQISTEDDEITVNFGAFHMHFSSAGLLEPEEAAFAKALDFIDQILAGRVSVASWWHEGRWQASKIVVSGCLPHPPPHVEKGAELRLTSWTGYGNSGNH